MFFESFHADHDCTGEDCPICQIIQNIRTSVKSLVLLLSSTAVFISTTSFITFTADNLNQFYSNSLVAQKVKISD
ncbi:MAG: hypothetical protein K6G52_02325 [Treponemataceae bacterium]|nr:hypothetical protein [Treponemataceae bacterium]